MTIRRILAIAGFVVVALAVALISLGSTVWSQARPTDSPAASATPAEGAAARARADLAARLSVDAGAIEVQSTAPHTWTDTSLGLPEPGMMYAQIDTSGYIVTLSYNDKTYVYHVAGKTARLEESMDPASASEPSIEEAAAVAQAREALADRVDAPIEELTLESVEAKTWNDASLGLPEPGMMYAQVLTDGYVVTLSYGGQSYVYHVAGDTAKLEETGN